MKKNYRTLDSCENCVFSKTFYGYGKGDDIIYCNYKKEIDAFVEYGDCVCETLSEKDLHDYEVSINGICDLHENKMTEQPNYDKKEVLDKCTTLERTIYILNGELHRLDGPAVEWADGSKSWFKNGRRHRLDGPALERVDGTKSWYIEGVELTEQEFNERTRND